MRDSMIAFTLDAMAKCGLGVEAHAFADPAGPMRTNVDLFLGKKRPGSRAMFKVLFMLALPAVGKWLKLSFLNAESSRFLVDVIRRTLEHRRRHGERRGDFIDLCKDALESVHGKGGEGKENEDENENDDSDDLQFERDAAVRPSSPVHSQFGADEVEAYLIANAFVLFFAGFDTSSNVLANMMYYLAKNPEVQERAHAEVAGLLDERGEGAPLDYAAVHSLGYLDMVVHETLRMFPLINLERVCVRDYELPGTGFTVPEGMLVQVPAAQMMQDERFFPNPAAFNPEHFSAEARAARSPYAFLGFGQGPRNCVGMRFALTAVKVAAIKTLARYRVVPSARTVDRLVPDPKLTGTVPIGGVFLKVESRGE